MSQKRNKHDYVENRGRKAVNEGKKNNKNSVNSKYKEYVIRKLYEAFQDSFDPALIASVAHTCQWDLHKASEALVILSGRKKSGKKNKSVKNEFTDGTRNKAKSLPGTLKQEKPNGKGMGTSNSAHCSTSSLSSGQVWQRHYKSKPQSPGLLTMIPPHSKEIVKLKKTESGRTTPKSKQSVELKKANAVVTRIQQLVQNGVKVLILMRGVPGSGKTHLAQVVVSLVTGHELSQHIFSTDDYFIMLGRGNYAYDFNQVPQAHNWNQKRVSEALKRGINPVVVDNTNTQAWEMQPYVTMAVERGYLIEVLEPVTDWRTKEAELAKKNVHSVPREKIRQMLDRYEPGWTGDKLLKSFGLKYKHCGSAHISQEKPSSTNSVLAQHRQHAVIGTPEKPKRKRNEKKKDRRNIAGIEVTEDKEKQLEELNKLFAEYGKTMDPISKQKVLDSGVPISEVVARMRKLQGSILPLPKTNVPSTIPEADNSIYDNNVMKPVPNYSNPRRNSFSESAEHDTMSSSNASEISECETDTDVEIPKWKEIEKYLGYGDAGHFVDGEDLMEDYDEEEDESRTKSEGATGGKSPKGHFTSSQEELSLIDFGTSNPPGSYSQDDLSLLNYDGNESPNDSSSSEEQETQMLTLQESLREVLMDNTRIILESSKEIKTKEMEKEMLHLTEPSGVDLSDSLLKVMEKRFNNIEQPKINVEPETNEKGVSINESLLEMLVKKYSQEEPGKEPEKTETTTSERKKSPDLEAVPLPSIPPSTGETTDWSASKRNKFEDIVNSWVHPSSPETIEDSSPKQARPRNYSLGAIKKTGIQRDKSPEELLRSKELSWSSIPFTSSWDDISKKPSEPEVQNANPKPQRKVVQKADSSTNTLHTDFDLWKKNDEGIIKMTAQNRNINQNFKAPATTNYVSEILMLDKSSMTLDAEELTYVDDTGSNDAIEVLSGMFPGIPKVYLSDIFEKCMGNMLWTIEVLLESPHNSESLPERPAPPQEENPPSYNEAKAMCESELPSIQNLVISDGKKTIKRRKDKKGSSSELSLLLKKQIEDSIQINEELYQDKTLFLKKLRHGEIEFGDEPIEPAPTVEEPNKNHTTEREPEMEEEEEEEEETIPMKIDPEFFKALAKHFGSSDEANTEKQAALAPTIKVPLSLAHQIYDCWLENVNKQLEDMQTVYDKMVKEDELFAAALQEQEFEYRQPDLREIMDMELAMLLYKQDQAHLQEHTRDTIATKLSKQLLFEAYPKMDKKMLLDLFESEGRSFRKTVDVLSAQENESPITVIAPEFLAAHGNKLLKQAELENLKKSVDTSKKPISVVNQNAAKKESQDDKNILLINPAEHRQKAALLHQQRNECARLAQEAFRKKSFSVASYFSRIAGLYKERIRDLNREPFPNTLFDEKGNNKLATKVDLHFLFVPEALQVLDLFLDHHIKQLREKNSEEVLQLNLVTGRGQHSFNRISKIKPAVEKRLEQRGLRFWENNPGMIAVKIHKKELLSEEF